MSELYGKVKQGLACCVKSSYITNCPKDCPFYSACRENVDGEVSPYVVPLLQDMKSLLDSMEPVFHDWMSAVNDDNDVRIIRQLTNRELAGALRTCASRHRYSPWWRFICEAAERIEKAAPRLLTLAELRNLEKMESDIWIETKYHTLTVDTFFAIYAVGGIEYFDTKLLSFRLEDYGAGWRCWTARPSEDQRKETKWDG